MALYTAPLFVKAVADGNANAVDKALEALTEFLVKASEQHVVKWVRPLFRGDLTERDGRDLPNASTTFI